VAGTAWQEARNGARRVRADLFPNAAPDALLPADDLLRAALRAAGLRCTYLPPADPLLSGAHAVLDTEAASVWLRADAPPEDRRVYIAHELAHLHQHEGGDLCACDAADLEAGDDPRTSTVGYGPRQRRETEANVWAREFLLPTPLAHRLFHEEHLDAVTIAARVGVAVSVVYAQLAEVLAFSPPAPSGGALPAGANVPLDRVIGLVGGADKPNTKSSGTLVPAHSAPPEGGRGGEKANDFPLDLSQRAAAHAQSGPLLVGAGPGTGKTRTLTARVLFLTGELGVAPENLLALTFSRKAAEEMRERIGAAAPEVAQRAAITTFHAFGFDLLRRHGKAAGLPPNPVLLDRADACALLEKRAASLGLTVLRYLHDPAYPLPDALAMIGRAKEDLVTPEEFARRAEAAGDAKLEDVARVYAAYEELLREKGALDFSDLVCRALRLLINNDDVRAAERAQWRHILVDEYQDINRAGALLVRALAGGDGTGLWAVGDLRQAIYRFRGASPANVTRFQTDFPQGKRTELTVNYRSRPALVRLFGQTSGEGDATWQPSRVAEDPSLDATITLAVADDDAAQADGIVRHIRAFEAAGHRLGQQAVLCRTRGQARALRAHLTERGVPLAPGPDENNLLAGPDVKALLALLSRACEPNGPARHRWPELPEGVGVAVAGDAYSFCAEALWGHAGLARTLTDPAAVSQLLALARSFRDRAPVLLDEDEDPHRAFLRHLRRMARMGAALGSRPEPTDAPDAVHVLTVHASKGLEFPVVFVPNLSAGKFPPRGAPSLLPPLPAGEESDTDPTDAEETRLFFVALTRARDHLVLSRAEKYGRFSAKPSPLLPCLDGAASVRVERWEPFAPPAPSGGALRVGASVPLDPASGFSAEPKSQNTRSNGTLVPADSAPPGGGRGGAIPARDADLYLRCPRRYFYERVAELRDSERMPYAAFKRAVAGALEEADPAAALDGVWDEKGPDPTHPHAPLYREAAEEIVGRAKAGPVGEARFARAKADAPVLEVVLPSGVVTVQADAVEAGGAVLECRTFRRPPAEGEESAPGGDRWLSLLQEAAKTAGPGGTAAQVRMRFLQDGQVLPVADRPRQRANHLAAYEGALRGIQLNVFPPEPGDDGDCPSCPYFFICPD
jgi:superfamily I DNA/RNA helicase/Zn-dependent peptidase ImmA (M78 family)